MGKGCSGFLSLVMVAVALLGCGPPVEVTNPAEKPAASPAADSVVVEGPGDVTAPPAPMAAKTDVAPRATPTALPPGRTVAPRASPTSKVALEEPDTWPTEGWPASTPEEQGMDSRVLLAMLEAVQSNDPGMGGILVVRDGTLVLEAYYAPFAADVTQNIQSCTKSIVSTLMGIAIDQGAIEGVDQPVLSFFPGRTLGNMEERKEAFTIEDLLTMRPGLRCFVTDRELTLEQVVSSPDWVQFFLDRRMPAPPGTLWTYCSQASYLLSVILQEATGQSALDFANDDPLIEQRIGLDGVTRYSVDAGSGEGDYAFHTWLRGFWRGDDVFVVTGLARAVDHRVRRLCRGGAARGDGHRHQFAGSGRGAGTGMRPDPSRSRRDQNARE